MAPRADPLAGVDWSVARDAIGLQAAVFAVEYSVIWDYTKRQGGTGRIAQGFFSILTVVW